MQRFGEDLRGFENVCAHRFYPLRTQDKGNGPIRCGFHPWQYNKDGLAVGIPKSQELYGQSPRELDARLKPVELATCGILIFGRFPAAEKAETLEQFLVNLRPRVKRGRCDVSDRTVGGSDDDDVATLLERSCLDPVNIFAVDTRLQR